MSSKTIGNRSDLGTPVSKIGTKERHNCPYCVLNGKTPDDGHSLSYDIHKNFGICFRCATIITSDGVRDLEYIKSLLLGSELSDLEKGNSQKLLISWTTPIAENPVAYQYMLNRYIEPKTLERFNIRATNEPFDGVVFINEFIEEKYTSYYQIRVINEDTKHAILRDQVKKLAWLCYADTPDIIIVEGFTSGLSAYQHCGFNPVVLSGKSMTDYQLHELRSWCSKHSKPNIYVCLDGGFLEEALKVCNKIYKNCYNAVVKIVPLVYNADPNDLNQVDFNRCLGKALNFEPSLTRYIRNKVYNNGNL
jgi:hypothetical protein